MTISLKADASGTFGTLQVGGVDKLVIGPNTVAPAAGVTMVGNGPAFRAYQNAVTSVGLSAAVVLFQLEEYDTAAAYNPATGRFQPLIAGYYQINWQVMTDATSNTLNSSLRKNGADYTFGSRAPTSGAFPLSAGSALVLLNGSSDYIDVAAYGSSVANTNATPGSNQISGFLARSV